MIVDKKKEELDKLQQQEIDKLEAISGLSAEEVVVTLLTMVMCPLYLSLIHI